MTPKALFEYAQAAKQAGAPIHAGIAAAQALLESGYGKSQLSSVHNNYFGIKGSYRGHSVLLPTKEVVNGKWITIQAEFRSYPTVTECFVDYGDIIRRLPWYQDAEDAADRGADFLRGLLAKRDSLGKVIEPGWATDPDYFKKVWAIAEREGFLIDKDVIKTFKIGDGWKVKAYSGSGSSTLQRTDELNKIIHIRRD